MTPPSKASCDALKKRRYPVTALERWCCPDADQPNMCKADGRCEEIVMPRLARRFATGANMTPDEFRMLRALCRRRQDIECVSCAEWKLQNP